MRIAIVNDCAVAVDAMRRTLSGGKHALAWVARNGGDAIERCKEDPPDLLLMDLIMPGMDGVETTRRIMRESPCPILIVTAAMDSQSAKVFDAMGAGALDVAPAPTFGLDGAPTGTPRFLAKIEAVARILGQAAPKSAGSAGLPKRAGRLVAIGSSAGGPAALVSLLRSLPSDFPAAVVIVQHVDAHFAPGLAQWLNDASTLPVRAAASGDVPVEGQVLLAASNDHLVFESTHRLGYTPHPIDYSYRPSVNVFFESAARRWPGEIVGVLLTGMGSDGASGLKTLRNLGHHTVAQDRESSAVYGMPRAAAEIGGAAEILPLDSIGRALGQRFYASAVSADSRITL